MIITWYGLSCFLIKTASNARILMDPYDPSFGAYQCSGAADIITISHSHIDHSYINPINSHAQIIKEPGEYNLGSVKITGCLTAHDNMKGAKRGANIVYIVEADGIRLCHLGDLGQPLSDEEADLLSDMDVLFIPVSRNFTLSPKAAFKITQQLRPKIIIPMHYASKGISFPVGGIEKFITLVKKATALDSNSLEITSPVQESNAVTLFKLPDRD